MIESLMIASKHKPSVELLEVIGNKPAGRAYHKFAYLGGELYTMGGYNGAQLADIWKFNLESKQWLSFGNASASRHSYVMVEDPNGENFYALYRAGLTGVGNGFTRFNRVSGTKTEVSLSSSGVTPRQEAVSGVVDGYVYMFGGWPSTGVMLNDLWRWTPGSTTMQRLTAEGGPAGRRGGAGIGLGKYLYVGGGRPTETGADLKDFWRYDTVENVWERLPDMPDGLNYTTFVEVNNKIYTVSGTLPSSLPNPDLFCYNPKSNSWSVVELESAPDMKGPAVRAVGKDIYIFGGVRRNGSYSNDVLKISL